MRRDVHDAAKQLGAEVRELVDKSVDQVSIMPDAMKPAVIAAAIRTCKVVRCYQTGCEQTYKIILSAGQRSTDCAAPEVTRK